VHVHATLRHGALTITVACADEAAREAVRAALPAMHRELAAVDAFDLRVDSASFGGAPSGGSSNGSGQGSALSGGWSGDARSGQPGAQNASRGYGPSDSAGDPPARRDPRPRVDRGLDRWM